MATVSYIYDLKCNGGNVSQVKINGTDVKRLKVNGVDVIHKYVTYKTTATINCRLHFNSLKAMASYHECGAYYSNVRGDGYFYVSSSTSGDRLSDSGGSIPKVEVYFDSTWMFNTHLISPTYGFIGTSIHSGTTFPILLSPNGASASSFLDFSIPNQTAFVTTDPSLADKSFRIAMFVDESNGSVLRTSWGDENISAPQYTYLTPDDTNMSDFTVTLGYISKTFTRTVQEY